MNSRILPDAAKPKVIPGEAYSGAGSLFQRLAPVIERCFLPFLGGEDVVFDAANGSYFSPATDDERIWIIMWSTPRDKDRSQLLGVRTILGHPTQNQTRAFPSVSGRGHRIEAEPRGPAVAQIFGRRIYILASITEEPKPILELILETILSRALEIFINNSVVFPESLYSQVHQKPDKDIISTLLFPATARIQALEGKIEQLRSEACALEGKLTSGDHNIRRVLHDVGLEEQLLSLSDGGEPAPELGRNLIAEGARLREKAREEFEFIVTYPLLRYLPHSSQSKLTVYTRHMTTRHRGNGDLHDLGFYRIVVPVTKAADFRWFNLTRRNNGMSNGMNHPHVYAEGHACLGNAKDALEKVMEQGDLYGTMLLGVRFVTSCNVNDTAGRSLINWPLLNQSS